MSSTPARKEQSTFAKRLEILQKLKDGVPVDQLAVEYGIHTRTIYRYRRNAASIQQASNSPSCLHLKKKPTLLHEVVDTRLYSWIVERRALGEILTDSLMQEKARQLHEEFGGPSSFTASQGWLQCFKRRHNMYSTSVHGEGSDANKLAADKFIEELSSILLEENIDEENIYNMDETSLMWKALPRRTLANEEELRVEDRNVKKDRVTVAFCVNATGSYKLPPLFVNKFANPRALKHCQHILPVVYKSQYHAMIDETVFNDWYTNHFKPSVRQHQAQGHRTGKVLLLVGNCRKHMLSQQTRDDSQFKLMFFPSSTTSIIQPMDQGIIAECKTLFRHKLLRRVLQHDGIRQFYAHYDVKDCIDLISEAWDAVVAVNIRNAWRKLLDQTRQAENTERQYPVIRVKQEFANVDVRVKQEFENADVRVKQEFENVDVHVKQEFEPLDVHVKEEVDHLGESIPSEEITEWISECENTESTAAKDEENDTRPRCQLEEEEIDLMFNNLAAWAETEPELIKQHAKFLIDYYNTK